MAQYVIYLRKSRADAEAEQYGEGETLARHEKTLIELARRQKLNVVDIYREVVSGETIAARPMMQKLLGEVEQGLWTGVIVMEIERLARGDSIDQGIISQTFKYSDTKIITPTKTYDPSNEFDEEFFEFGLFMSRREYKTINRRLQRGRIASVKEGKYVGNRPPYGYVRIKLDNSKGFTLAPDPEQAEVVRMIFELYTRGELQDDGSYRRIGISLIVKKLNQIGIKPQRGDAWVLSSIRDILINPVYIGKVRWNWRPANKKMINGQIKIERPRNDEVILVDGLHPAIIDKTVFDAAQYIISSNPASPVTGRDTMKNPLSGLIYCGKCGRSMIRKINKNGPDTLMCPAPHCNNISSALELVEERLLVALDQLLKAHQLKLEDKKPAANNKIKVYENQLKTIDDELEGLQRQLNKIYDMLEKEIYSTDQFLERSKAVSDRQHEVSMTKDILNHQYQSELSKSRSNSLLVPKIQHLLDVYFTLPSAQSKNDLLKEILAKATYVKNSSGRYKGVDPKDFELQIYPKINY